MIKGLRSDLMSIFENFKNPHAASDSNRSSSTGWVDMAMSSQEVAPSTYHHHYEDPSTSQALAPFTGGIHPSLHSSEPSQTTSLAALQMDDLNHQHAYAASHYPMQQQQPSDGDLSVEVALHDWFRNGTSPYPDPWEGPGYDDS